MGVDMGAQGSDFSEVKAPLILLTVGTMIYIVYGIVGVEDVSVGVSIAGVLLDIVISVAFAIPACFIVAKLVGASFGFLKTAVLKLAALAIFPSAVGMLIPGLGGWISLAIYFGLLEWFFDLEFWQSIVFVVVLWGLQVLTVMLIYGFIWSSL